MSYTSPAAVFNLSGVATGGMAGDITITVSSTGAYAQARDLFSIDSIGYAWTTYTLGTSLYTTCGNPADKYEFGYNGQMKMNEIAGIGNHNSALFWEYSPQIGRRWNLDPVVKEWESGYATFSNNPIYYSDILGNISVPTPTASDQDGDGNKDREDKKEEDKKEKKKEETPNSSSSTTGGNSSSGTGGGGNKMSTGDQNAIKTAIAVPIPGLVTVPEVVIPAGAGTAIGAATGGIAIAVGGAYLFLKYALPAELTPAGWQEDPNSACSTQVWTPQGMKPKVFVPSAEAIRIGILLSTPAIPKDLPWTPGESPGTDWVWKGGKNPPESGKGNWVNDKTGQRLHPDLAHRPPKPPH